MDIRSEGIRPKPKPKVVLGIDPGSRFAGFGLLLESGMNWQHLESGVIRLKTNQILPDRLLELSLALHSLYDKYRPDLTVVEKVFLGKNVDSAFTLGHARGVVLLEAARSGSEIREYAARSVKKSVTGYGAADKVQVQNFLKSLLGVPSFERDDASDALALALHGARLWKSENQLRAGRVEFQ